MLAQSLFQTELPGQDMVRHADRFLEKDLQELLINEKMVTTSITSQNNRVYTIKFVKCYVSPPFFINSKKKHIPLNLVACRRLGISYNLGIWVDIEFNVKTYTVVPPLRNFQRHVNSKCFFAPCLFLEYRTNDPRDSVRGFVCRRTTKEGPQWVYDQRLDVEFPPGVLASFHEDAKNRQNANSANVVDVDTYTIQLWTHEPDAFEKKIWNCGAKNPKKSSKFHILVKNLLMLGTYDVQRDVFVVKHLGKKSILRGKTVHTKPPYLEQHDFLFEKETTELIPNNLLLQVPCMVGSSLCWTRRQTLEPFRYDASILHTGKCEKVIMRNLDFRTNACYVKQLEATCEGVVRSTHDLRGSRRSTSATSVFVTPTSIYLVLPFLTTDLDRNVQIHVVEFIKLMLDLERTPSGDPPSQCSTMDQLLNILTLKFFGRQPHADQKIIVDVLRDIFARDSRVQHVLKESRFQVLCRLGSIGSRQASRARQIKAILHTLHTECLPHLFVSGTATSRKFKLVHILENILWPTLRVFAKLDAPTDLYSLRNKRVTSYNHIIGVMFQQSIVRFKKRKLNDLYQMTGGNVFIDSTIIHSMFHNETFGNMVFYGFNTGNTEATKKKGNQSKVEKKKQVSIETLLAVNTEGKIGNIRRFHVAHAQNNYSQAQRQLHPSQWHFICPAEVPEGERCGLVMNFALGVRTSVGYMDVHQALETVHRVLAPFGSYVARTLEEAAVQLLDSSNSLNCSSIGWIYIDQVIVGRIHQDQDQRTMLLALKEARAYGLFHMEVSIYALDRNLYLETCAGRLLRPMLRAEFLANHVFHEIFHRCMETHTPVWQAMEQRHVIEFYSPHEIEDRVDVLVVAPNFQTYNETPSKYTHVEVAEIMMYSNMAANSTLQDHNAAVRTSYACKHRSQAAASRPLYSDSSPDNSKLELNYAQSPLVESITNRMTHHTLQTNLMTECIFGIINDETTCEDGVIVSKGFIERGGMSITKTQEFHAQENTHHFIRVPPRCTTGMKMSNYRKLDPKTGMVPPGTKVEFNDVLVGIVFKDTKTNELSDKSIVYSKKIPGVVARIDQMKTRHGITSYTLSVQLTGVTHLQVGDKLASPYSQKGVVVAIVPDEDMPEVAYGPCMGMRLDLSFNCHGIPTRMTGATTDAPLYGMYACKYGKRVNGTAFNTHRSESREEFVKRMGGDGKVWMRNPKTGKLFPDKIFVGCTSYMRLNHLVAEKAHARNGGPVDHYRQPKAGRINNGGLRMGKMERMATEGHGAAEFTHERMFVMSDRSIAYVCRHCSSVNGEPPVRGQSRGLCRLCHDPYSCVPVEMPYSTIVLLNYMKASGMPVSLDLAPAEDQADNPFNVSEGQGEETEEEWSDTGMDEVEDFL